MIYLRISLDREMDGLAIERQREDCERLAEREGWTVVETYVDQSKSATDATKSRPDYDRMVADYQAGAFDAIVCWDLDRLTRQPRQMEDWVDAARFRGLQLKSVSGDVDLTNENGLLIAGIKIQVARAEVVRKSKRQSRAQEQRAMMGRAPKGMRPLGYATNGDVIEDEAVAVRAIFALFTRPDHPESLRSLARALSGTDTIEGLAPMPKHTHTVSVERETARRLRAEEENKTYQTHELKPDGPWSPSTVLGILRNPRYAGMSTYTPKTYQENGNRRRSWRAQILRDDVGEPVRGQWAPIVDDETWWRVQEILDDTERVTNTSGSTRRKHLGSGLYRCGVCGRKVTGAPRGYRCAGHVMRTGSHIDEFVTEVIAARLSRRDALARVSTAEDTPHARAISEAISRERARMMRAQRDYDAEVIEGRDLKRIRDAGESRIDELEAERLLRGRAGGLAPVLGTADPAAAFRQASLTTRREVIDTLAKITLLPQARGRRGFDPHSVVIEWRTN
ncbi:recombinase family protein [Propionibacterium freudenreichii]|uniref:recombinase family protein n=1 Tax=Propionibacterium freudenreichii TaxID=1744 RepID=UPI00254FF53C|nr:recombinase family protein [Propionibacterium freudenreichii]